MSRLLLLFLLLFSKYFSNAQTLKLGTEVIATAGGSGAQGNYDVSWTLGEPVIQTIRNQNFIVTQGFHQPDLFSSVATWDPALAALHISVFPNPASEKFNLKLDGYDGQALELFVFDTYGKQLQGPMQINLADTVVDCYGWPPGIYFLSLRNPVRKTSADLKVIKF